MTTEFQYWEPDRTVSLFLYCVGLLKVDDNGLMPGHDLGDLNAVAFMCHMMKTLAIAPRDVRDVLLLDLADSTEDLITTAVMAPEGDVVKRWVNARAAVLQNSLSAM